jgi:hypothetical protein
LYLLDVECIAGGDEEEAGNEGEGEASTGRWHCGV